MKETQHDNNGSKIGCDWNIGEGGRGGNSIEGGSTE